MGRTVLLFLSRDRFNPDALPAVRELLTIQAMDDEARRYAETVAWMIRLLEDPDKRWWGLQDLLDNVTERRHFRSGRPWGTDLWAAMTTEQRCLLVEMLFHEPVTYHVSNVAFLVEEEPDESISPRLLEILESWVYGGAGQSGGDTQAVMEPLARRLVDARLHDLASQHDSSTHWLGRHFVEATGPRWHSATSSGPESSARKPGDRAVG